MNKIIYILALLTVIFTVGCKKIEPPLDESEANDPIYLLEGLMNGDSIKLYVNDTTIFISSAPYNMNNVEAYSSTISDSENDFELKMIVLRPEIYIDEEGIKLVENANANYIVHKTICKEFNFSNSSNQADFLNVNINGYNSQGSIAYVKEYGKYIAELEFTNVGGSQIHNVPIEVGFSDNILNPFIDIESSGNIIYFSALNTELTHEWLIDDELVSTDVDDEVELSNGIHSIKHSIIDGFGNIATYSTLMRINNDELMWVMDYSYCSSDMIENNYGSVIVEVMHEGELYTSVHNSTNLDNNLEISNVNYVVDGNTQSIDFVKFNIKFDVELKTEDNSKTLNLKDMKGIFHIEVN